MLSLFHQGGWVMYPLLAFSVAALAVVLERSLYYFTTRRGFEAFLASLQARWETEDPSAIASSLENRRDHLSAVTRTYLLHREKGETFLEEALFLEGTRILERNEAWLPALAAAAHLAPLLGLFGTVLGMIDVFRTLEAAGGRADVRLLAGGIWVALITTAFGLLIAIPAMAAHHCFSGLAARKSEELRLLVGELNLLTGMKAGGIPSGSAACAEAEEDRYETLHTS